MKSVLLVFFVLVGAQRCVAQDAVVAIKQQAREMVDAMLAGDYEKLAAHTSRQVVAAMGGREAIVVVTKKSVDGMKAQGITIQDVQLGEPGPTQKVGAETVSLVPETVTLKVPGGRMVSNTCLIGISEDGGKNWLFTDSAGLAKNNAALFAKVFPELAGKVHIPEVKEPVYTAD